MALRFVLVVVTITANASGIQDPLPAAAHALLLDGARAGDRLIVVGDRGHILISDDEATSWRQVDTPTNALLTAIHMHDSLLGWVVGHDAVILRTDDGGESWQLVYQAPQEELPLLDIWFADERSGIAIGAYGHMLVTGDGGEAWSQHHVSEDDFHLNALAPTAQGRLYLAGEAGQIYRSDDHGLHWRPVPTPYHGSWFGAQVLGSDRIVVVGLRGHMFHSTDGGLTWSAIITNTTAGLTSIQSLPSGEWLVTGHEGVLLIGDESSHNTTLTTLPDRRSITGALALTDGDWLLMGEFGVRRWPNTD